MPYNDFLPKINLLNNLDQKEIEDQLKPKPPKKSKRGKVLFFTIIFIIFFLISFSLPIIISTKNILKNFGSGDFLGLWQTVVKLISAQDKLLKGEKENRINILILGIGGKGHDGPNLTDTIILASINPTEEKVATISIPRDLYVPIPGYSWRKINNAYAFGEIEEKGGELISEVIENIFEIPIHYYVVCDFEGFKKITDSVGGINIDVERSFTDNQYPTPNSKVQTISFKQGWQKMSGEEALKFVRSRHGNNQEGSDFARSKRQLKVILSLKNKVFSFSTLVNPSRISNLLNSLSDNIKTDLKLHEIIRLANLAKEVDYSKIISKVLDNNGNGLLYSDITIDGAFVLRPKAGNFKELAFFVNNIFNEPADMTLANEKSDSLKTKLIVQNGTTYPGLAFNTAQDLKKMNFEVLQIGNASRQDYEKTIIYDLTKGEKKAILNSLKEKFKADISSSLPDFLEVNLQPDFLIILGKNNIPASTTINYSL